MGSMSAIDVREMGVIVKKSRNAGGQDTTGLKL